MYCPGCGKEVREGDNFCPWCDRKLNESAPPPGTPVATAAPQTEELFFTFGPFGVDVCNGPFKIFTTWHRRNSIIIELTNTRLCALPNKGFGLLAVPATPLPPVMGLPFEIPYDSITSVEIQRHPSPIARMDILNIKYGEAGIFQEKSIASYKNNIQRAYEVIYAARQGQAPE